jgi:rod shape-determining protein MreD
MAYLIGVPVLAALAVLQSTILGSIRLLDGAPDLILLAVIGWGLAGRPRQSMGLALTGGAFLDLLSAIPLGVSSLTLIIAAYLVSLGEGRFWEANFLTQLAAVMVASMVFHFGQLGVLFLLGRPLDLTYALSRVILPSLFLNLLLALPVAQLAESVQKAIYPSEVSI